MLSKEMHKSLDERRKRNFQAILNRDGRETYLKITHNGHQWQGIDLNHFEMDAVIDVLAQELGYTICKDNTDVQNN